MGSDLTIDEAYFINDWGEIMALGVFPNGDYHAVPLVPDGDCDALEARIAALPYKVAPEQNLPVIKQGESFSPAIQFRNRFLQRYRLPGPAATPLNSFRPCGHPCIDGRASARPAKVRNAALLSDVRLAA